MLNHILWWSVFLGKPDGCLQVVQQLGSSVLEGRVEQSCYFVAHVRYVLLQLVVLPFQLDCQLLLPRNLELGGILAVFAACFDSFLVLVALLVVLIAILEIGYLLHIIIERHLEPHWRSHIQWFQLLYLLQSLFVKFPIFVWIPLISLLALSFLIDSLDLLLGPDLLLPFLQLLLKFSHLF